jgi:hypothetical protein
MCDYSLMSFPNRLAQEGENLVSHRFQTGTMGLAAQADLQVETARAPAPPKGFWQNVKAFFAPAERIRVTAVCIPPGARLLLMDISEELQDSIGVARAEEVIFTQITAAADVYRDAVRFRNGCEVILQRLREGQRVRVLALGPNAQDEWVGAGAGRLPVQR